jgi:Plasmid pRiA4b ORF-3-like protein
LHGAIQAAMGWEDCHLHSFDIEGRQYGNPRSVGDVADEERVTLKDLITSGVARFAYSYDFGDNWEHALVVEKRLPDVEALSRPICTAGKRRCPPEDCGGPWGYRKLLEILADPAHPEHAERCEWLGEDFDPDDFNPEIADATLAARFSRA